MKIEELTKCAICRKRLMHNKSLFFHRIKIERMAFEMNAVNREVGMEIFFSGNIHLARVFSANEDIAKPLDKEITVLICDKCISDKLPYLCTIIEEENDKGER